MSTQPQAQPEGALSLDAAVDQLDAQGRLDEQPEGEGASEELPPETAETTDEPAAEEASGDDPEADEEQPEGEAAAEPQDAPKHFDAEDRAWFESLNPEAQAKIAKQELKREAVFQKAKAAVAEEADKLKADNAVLQQLAPALLNEVSQSQALFKARWDGINWSQLAAADPPLHHQLKTQAEAELNVLNRLEQANAATAHQAQKAFVAREKELLTQTMPELLEAEKGPQRQTELGNYLLGKGMPAERWNKLSALEAELSYKAMLHDKAQAGLQTQQAAQKPKSGTKPIAAKPGAPPNPNRSAQTQRNRFAQTRSVEDAVGLLNMTG